MKGVIFCALEKLVVSQGGADAWERLVAQTPLNTVGGGFIGPGLYPDEDLHALVAAASAMTGRPIAELLRAFGRSTFPEHVSAYPLCLPAGITAKRFLLSVDRMMRVEVNKLQPGASLPYFDYEDPGPDQLVMIYRSSRGLCDFAAGLIEGAADYLGDEVMQVHTQCTRDGYPSCRFELRFGPPHRREGPVV